MLLAIDIGNSDVVLGVYQGEWRHLWRIRSLADEPVAFYELRARDYFLEAGIRLSDVDTVVLSSVVPALTDVLALMVERMFGYQSLILGPEIYASLPVAIHNPYEIGADLVANAMAASHHYGSPCIVVDFGTALTFTTLSAQRELMGVAIAPGLKTAIKALFLHTARLPEVPLELPESAIGKDTVHAIQAGVLLGYTGLVSSLLAHIRSELGTHCPAIATGGLSAVLHPIHSYFDAIEPTLTLEGLRLIASHFAHP
jgi:type III pantothenate kinase